MTYKNQQIKDQPFRWCDLTKLGKILVILAIIIFIAATIYTLDLVILELVR